MVAYREASRHCDPQPAGAAARLVSGGGAAPCKSAATAVLDLTQSSMSDRDEVAGATDVLRGDSTANAIALEDDVSDDEPGPASAAHMAPPQQQQQHGPRRLNRLRRAGSPRADSSAASGTARHEPANSAGTSIDGLVTGFGSLQVTSRLRIRIHSYVPIAIVSRCKSARQCKPAAMARSCTCRSHAALRMTGAHSL
jgi:hypothetical protein